MQISLYSAVQHCNYTALGPTLAFFNLVSVSLHYGVVHGSLYLKSSSPNVPTAVYLCCLLTRNFGVPAKQDALLLLSELFYYEVCGIAHMSEDKHLCKCFHFWLLR